VNAVFQFNIKGAQSTAVFIVDLKNGKGSLTRGEGNIKPDCTITIGDDDYFAMSTGKLNPQQAFMAGKLKLAGNMMLAQKLSLITQAASKL